MQGIKIKTQEYYHSILKCRWQLSLCKKYSGTYHTLVNNDTAQYHFLSTSEGNIDCFLPCYILHLIIGYDQTAVSKIKLWHSRLQLIEFLCIESQLGLQVLCNLFRCKMHSNCDRKMMRMSFFLVEYDCLLAYKTITS